MLSWREPLVTSRELWRASHLSTLIFSSSKPENISRLRESSTKIRRRRRRTQRPISLLSSVVPKSMGTSPGARTRLLMSRKAARQLVRTARRLKTLVLGRTYRSS
jgi:hypothetical protein